MLDVTAMIPITDCFLAEPGAVIDAGCWFWIVTDHIAIWREALEPMIVPNIPDKFYTSVPLVAHRPPTPSDSPILALVWDTDPDTGENLWLDNRLLVCDTDDGNRWLDVTSPGSRTCYASDQIVRWCGVHILPAGEGVLAEHDRRDRVDNEGYRWVRVHDGWAPAHDTTAVYMLIADVDRNHGPLRFADENTDKDTGEVTDEDTDTSTDEATGETVDGGGHV